MNHQSEPLGEIKTAHSSNLMNRHRNPITGTNHDAECKVRIRPA